MDSKPGNSELNPGVLGTTDIRIPVPWGHVSAKAWGDPSGQRVLAVHGWMDNAGTFDRLIPLLHRSLYIVAIEMPGHGRSSHLPTGFPYHYIDYVATIRRVVKYLGWEKYWYMGHSMGGSLGFLFASLYHEEVERFVSIDQVKTITDPDSECRTRFSDGVSAFLSLDKVQRQENLDPKGLPYEVTYQRLIAYTRHCDYPLTEAAAKTLCIRGTRQINELEWAYNRDQRLMSSSILRFSHSAYLELIHTFRPKLLMVLANGGTVPEPEAVRAPVRRSYEKSCASYKLVGLHGNHFLHLNNPDEAAQEINEFFA